MKYVIQLKDYKGDWVDYASSAQCRIAHKASWSHPYANRAEAGQALTRLQQATAGHHITWRLAERPYQQA